MTNLEFTIGGKKINLRKYEYKLFYSDAPKLSIGVISISPSGLKENVSRISPGSLPVAEEKAVLDTLNHIDSGTKPNGILAKKWGSPFGNYQSELSVEPKGTYKEADSGTGTGNAGVRRIVVNTKTGEAYYTLIHYGDAGKPAFVQSR